MCFFGEQNLYKIYVFSSAPVWSLNVKYSWHGSCVRVREGAPKTRNSQENDELKGFKAQNRTKVKMQQRQGAGHQTQTNSTINKKTGLKCEIKTETNYTQTKKGRSEQNTR